MIAANVTFYTVVTIWLCLSLVTGKFVWRMTINVVFLIITSVYVVALLRIRKFIAQVNQRKHLTPNQLLMNLNLATFSLEVIFYFLMFCMTLILDSHTRAYNKANGYDLAQCQLIVGFDFSYCLVWTALVTRTAVTSYMNV